MVLKTRFSQSNENLSLEAINQIKLKNIYVDDNDSVGSS